MKTCVIILIENNIFLYFFCIFINFILNMATQYAILAEKYKNILSKSPTAYNPGATPTSSDISAQQQLMRAKTAEEIAKGEELKQEWYGEPATTEDTGSKKSYLQGVLHTLGAPLYGVVGSVEALLGKGTKKGLANIPENIKEQGLFGDLLRSYGMSNLIAAPLGFALDVAGDPINWLTAGTAALAPRVGMGAIKGGLTGAKAGLESGVLMKAEKLGRLVPGLTKKAFSEIPEQAGKTMASGYRNLAKKAVESREAYETITGTGLNKVLEESVTKVRVFDKLENWLNQRPWGQKTVKMLGYSPSRGFLQRGREDVANKIAGEIPEGMMGRAGSQVDSLLGKDAKETVEWAKNPSAMLPRHSIENDIRLAKEVNDDILQKKIIQKEMEDLNKGLLAGDEGLLTKLNSLSENQQKEFFSTLNYYRSGTKTYDKQIVKALLSPAGRKTLNSYALFIGAFKNAKIGGGILSSGTNAMIGNPVMATMFGIDITNPNFYKSLKESLKIIRGKDYRALLRNPEILEYAREYPIQFTSVTGIYPAQMTQGGKFFDKNFVNSITNEARKLGKNFDFKNVEDLNKVIDETLLKSNIGVESVNSTIANYLDRGIETSMMSTEIMRGPMGEMVKNLKKLSDEGNTLASMAHWYLTVPLETYSKIDQGYKVGTLLHFVENGISNDELIKIAKRIPISPNDVSQIPGRNLWKIKPSKSLEIANEMYMDYLAMPGFVKIMRTLPLAGSPFASFAFGMTAQVAKTAVYNPSVFNKVNYFIKEISGERSPLEKEALKQPYYKWYNRPGMLKIPFFEENPVYLNMENMLPYYTMNVFQPAERNYKNKYGDAVAAIMDKLPFFKDPAGQIMFDYFVQPLILQGEQPKGMFDQPLLTQDAGVLEKVGRGAQALTESIIPTMVGYAGLVAPWGETGEKITPYLPSYRWRQLAFAKKGKSSVGVPVKEPTLERTARVMSAMAGWPIYQIKLQYNK